MGQTDGQARTHTAADDQSINLNRTMKQHC